MDSEYALKLVGNRVLYFSLKGGRITTTLFDYLRSRQATPISSTSLAAACAIDFIFTIDNQDNSDFVRFLFDSSDMIAIGYSQSLDILLVMLLGP